MGKRVSTPEGDGRVGDVDVLAGRLRVYFEDRPPKVFTAAEVRQLAPTGAAEPASTGPEPDREDSPDGKGSD
jgi:hypothetical protein